MTNKMFTLTEVLQAFRSGYLNGLDEIETPEWHRMSHDFYHQLVVLSEEYVEEIVYRRVNDDT